MASNSVEDAARRLREGGTVVFPTETVYGLGADALNPIAVAKIFEIKRRPLSHPLIVHIGGWDWLERSAQKIPSSARRLVEAFWPGPLTVVLPKSDEIPDIVSGGLSSVGIRFPSHPIAQSLLRYAETPIAAPSANLFGTLSPTRVEHVESLRDRVDAILDGGACEVGLESTIVSFLEATPRLLRPGGLSREQIESLIGKIDLAPQGGPSIAPGMLAKHYAPNTPIHFCETGSLPAKIEGRVGVICFRPLEISHPVEAVEILSPEGDLRRAAADLFSALRRLDALDLNAIYALPFPEEGLGVAINDRLRRAAHHFLVDNAIPQLP